MFSLLTRCLKWGVFQCECVQLDYEANNSSNETHGMAETSMFLYPWKGSILQILSVLDVNGHITQCTKYALVKERNAFKKSTPNTKKSIRNK